VEAQVIVSPVRDASGAVTTYVALARDVTEERRERDNRRHLQKLEAIGTLAGGVAHDFNNLLTAINGDAGLALESAPPGSPLREDLEEIRRAGARAAELTRQLLAFGRRQVMKPEELDLNAVVTGVERMLRRLIGEDVTLETRLHDGLWRTRVDRGQIEQVIVNLAVNARDAMPSGGTARIETRNVTLDAREARALPEGAPGDYVLIEVADTGTGMDAATLARAFEPFFTTKGPGKGTGLGLAMVYGIVRQSRGFVGLRSAPGRGTVVHVYLPRYEAAGEMAPAPRAPVASGPEVRGGTVLVAEDEEQVRRLLANRLGAEGFRVLTAADGREALEVAGRHPGRIDVLLSDVVMPRLSGPDLARGLRAVHPETAVVFLTGHAEEAVERQGEIGGAAAFFEKPPDLDDLAATLRRLVAEGRAR
jgi:two-component system cell cycle sensor histidine kinase/response regulator CckA